MLLRREEFFVHIKGGYLVQRKHSVTEGTLNGKAGVSRWTFSIYLFVVCRVPRQLQNSLHKWPPAWPCFADLTSVFHTIGTTLGVWIVNRCRIREHSPTCLSIHVRTESVFRTVVKLASPVASQTFFCSKKTKESFSSVKKWYPGLEFESVSVIREYGG